MSKVYTYSKAEKLKSRKLIAQLFDDGLVVKSYPFRLHYILHSGEADSPLQAGVSVSKRYFKKAVDRNRVKRLIREAYRLQNQELKNSEVLKSTNLAMMIIYSNKDLPDQDFVNRKILNLLHKLTEKLKNQ